MAVKLKPQVVWQPRELIDVARKQKWLIWLIIAQVVVLLSFTASVIGSSLSGNAADPTAAQLTSFMLVPVVTILCMVGVYRLAKALREPAILYAVCMILPLISLILLLIINGKACGILQGHGLRVGLLGANRTDINRLKTHP